MMVFSGNANLPLAQGIARKLNIRLGRASVGRFSDGEVAVEIEENVRGVQVFVVQPTNAPTNENLMELLVMIDGRTVYSPSFSGVYWDVQDTLLEDIDRIEVIRGPGASIWGANAVNGVINIITRSAGETQGGFVTAGGGNEIKGFAGLRYGGEIADDTFARVYVNYRDLEDSYSPVTGGNAGDSWKNLSGGFRVDGQLSQDDSWLGFNS